MKTFSFKLLFSAIILLIPVFLIPGPLGAWEIQKEGDGIRVYTRGVEGSDFKAYRGVTTVNAPVSELVALVNDISFSPEWVETCKKGVLLERVSDSENYTYTVNDAPWPVSDRDAVVRNIIVREESSGIVKIEMRGAPDYIPEKPGMVRVRKLKGYWRFRPLNNNSTKVVYEVHSEPGGNIPSWLANSIVVTQPFHTLLNMKKVLGKKER